MKQKANRKRGMIFLLSAVMVFSAFAVAHAEEGDGAASHVHTNKCHNENGDLICGFAQADNGKDGKAGKRAAAVEVDSNIYPGEEEKLPNGEKVWVAYDAKYDATTQPADATVKATVTLPEGVEASPGYKLFIDKIEEEDSFYPSEENVKKEASAINEYQCYMIRWVKVDENGTYDKSDMKSIADVIGADNAKTADIRIQYLKNEARLSGPKGARKLLIYNSTEDGELKEAVSESVQNVSVEDDYYKSFTFLTNQAGPYVFVSKHVTEGYIAKLAIKGSEMLDGSDPFDKTDKPGNDSGPNNRIVRSYDTIQYPLDATFASRQQDITKTEVKMYFELTLNKSATAARFDISKMLWLGDNYSVEYLNSDGRVVMLMDHNGKFYEPQRGEDGRAIRDEDGFVVVDKDKEIKMNAQLNGSNQDKDSYKVASGNVIAQQKLTGCTTLKAKEGESILAGTQTFTTAVEVRNADNGEVFEPTFKMWLEGNEENYREEGTTGNKMTPAEPCEDNVVTARGDKSVKVSAGTNFNVQLKKNGDMSYKNWFDFSTGQLVEETERSELIRLAKLKENHGKSNPAEFTEEGKQLDEEKQKKYANYRYGRMTCYGITLQLYNDTDNEPEENRASKGLKGFSLPVGDITFDLNLYSKTNPSEFAGSDREYTAILWDYNENVPAEIEYNKKYDDPHIPYLKTPKNGLGNGGRRMYWDGESRSSYAKGAAPSNYLPYHDGCYYGGDWSLLDDDGKKVDNINRIAGPIKVTGTGQDTTYHFSVSNYDFDFDNQHFPKRDAGNSGNVLGYDTYARCFSAGSFQVLSVFPMVQKQSQAEIFLNTKVSNLQLTTRAGQELKAANDDQSKINHEVNIDDNTRKDQIVLYAPGNLTKGNSFNGLYKDKAPESTSNGFLGTDYWTTSYDCSAFAGDDIWIMSYGMISSGSDYRMGSMNLLQLFDSRALSVRNEPYVTQAYDDFFGDSPGKVKFLYAADPDHPEGYDTNKDGILEYMNSVREEDLVYSENMPDKNGKITVNGKSMKCIGVLMEIRGCNLLGGKYQYMGIPVEVNGDDETLIGKTIATVNTFRVWSYDIGDISWENGTWNKDTGKNVLKDYPAPGKEDNNEQYSGELANSKDKSPSNYVKTEYEDGLQKDNTHVGGTLAGNSLLILGYKAHVDIGVDNKNQTGSITYNQGNGETVVDYRLKNIVAKISDSTGQTKKPTTTLTVKAVLDENRKADAKQRISVSGNTYYMDGYKIDENGNLIGSEKPIAIGSDQYNPTKLIYKDSGGNEHTIAVYAQMDTDGQSVTFVIQNAPVGIELPDITFKADFASVQALKDNDTIKTGAYISGKGDCRAYSEMAGNMDNVTVGIVLGSGTNLTKAVQEKYIEVDSNKITYDVSYANNGTSTVKKIYFYDLLPHSGDIRGSLFDGDISLRNFKVDSGGSGNENSLTAEVYYSTTEYDELYDWVSIFGWIYSDGTREERSEAAVERMLREGKNKDGKPLFRPLGKVEQDKFTSDPNLPSGTDLDKLMGTITGLYVKAENLSKGQTIDMQVTIQAEGNKAGDWYKNIANSWIAGSETLALTSNKVETVAVSRSISGVVWYDWNLNGVRDVEPQGTYTEEKSGLDGSSVQNGADPNIKVPDEEALLEGVTVTLFKKNEYSKKYEICETDIGGRKILPVTTGKDGAYSFDKLANGDYIVAFSGESLEPYTDATFYQYNESKSNDSNTSDGVKTSELNAVEGDISGINKEKYPYCIQYSVGSPNMEFHSIDDIRAGKVALNNYREDYSHQDLGVIVAGYELPETGGMGTLPYMMGGILLILTAFAAGGFTGKRRKNM